MDNLIEVIRNHCFDLTKDQIYGEFSGSKPKKIIELSCDTYFYNSLKGTLKEALAKTGWTLDVNYDQQEEDKKLDSDFKVLVLPFIGHLHLNVNNELIGYSLKICTNK